MCDVSNVVQTTNSRVISLHTIYHHGSTGKLKILRCSLSKNMDFGTLQTTSENNIYVIFLASLTTASPILAGTLMA
jgi:hypothetical protein